MEHITTWKIPLIPLSRNNAKGGHISKNNKFIKVGGIHTLGCDEASFLAFLEVVPLLIDDVIPSNNDFIENDIANIKSLINTGGLNMLKQTSIAFGTISNKGIIMSIILKNTNATIITGNNIGINSGPTTNLSIIGLPIKIKL
jgi:hypothetical protein